MEVLALCLVVLLGIVRPLRSRPQQRARFPYELAGILRHAGLSPEGTQAELQSRLAELAQSEVTVRAELIALALDGTANRMQRVQAFCALCAMADEKVLRRALLDILDEVRTDPGQTPDEQRWRTTMRDVMAHRFLHMDIPPDVKLELVERAYPGDWRTGLEKAYFTKPKFLEDDSIIPGRARSQRLVLELVDSADSVEQTPAGPPNSAPAGAAAGGDGRERER